MDKFQVVVIGSGPSLSYAIPKLKQIKKTVTIVADSALKKVVENGIKPDIVVTDLDGDEMTLKKIGKTNVVFVVHAHGDNISKLCFIEKMYSIYLQFESVFHFRFMECIQKITIHTQYDVAYIILIM